MNRITMMTIAEHLESHLGAIAEGWGSPAGESGVQVVRFRDQPDAGVSTYATLGLSDHILEMTGERRVRQELLVAAHDRFPSGKVASFILTLAESLLTDHRALLRGDVIGPAEPIIPGSTARAVYATLPVVYEDSLASYEDITPPGVVVWLLPLLGTEVNYIRTHGWSAFEDRLEATDPDLFDLERESIV